MQCKAIYSDQPELGGLMMDVSPGVLTLNGEKLVLEGERPVTVALAEIRSLRMFRHLCLCRMIEIVHDRGTLFVAPICGIFFGVFAWVNFFGDSDLHILLI